MNSLKEVYATIEQGDQEKIAQAQAAEQGVEYVEVDADLLKQAQDYDHVGRVLAHNVFSDMVKEAMEGMEGMSDEEKKKHYAKTMAKATGEKSEDDEEEDDDDKDEDEESSEKKASVKAAILERMGKDPAYVSQLVAKYYPAR